MKRLGSLRFDGVLAPSERDDVVRLLASARIEVASWTADRSGTRTYAALRLPPADASAAIDVPAARFADPAPIALEVVPHDPERLPALVRAVTGPGGTGAVADSVASAGALSLELAPGGSLRLVLDLIDVETSGARRIRPLLPLGDAALAALAAATLGIPDLDASRLIETFAEPLLAGGA